MIALERNRTTVKLFSATYMSKLADLRERYTAAYIAEESGATQRRAGTRSKAAALAREHDELQENPTDDDFLDVELVEISNTDWQLLADEHPPREDDPRDKQSGLNMSTFPPALLRKALITQIDLDELSRAQYVKLENAAWNLHNGGDALPKLSLVSLHKQQRDPDSPPPHDSE